MITSVSKVVEELESLYFADGNVKMVQLLWKTFDSSQSVKHGVTICDSATPLLGMYPREMKTYIHAKICTQMFIAALFIITKKQKKENKKQVFIS